MGRKIEVQETVNKDFNFCRAIFAPPLKCRPRHVPCLLYPRNATDSISLASEGNVLNPGKILRTMLSPISSI